jgi:transcriptional regulator with XRE-family HTH domain
VSADCSTSTQVSSRVGRANVPTLVLRPGDQMRRGRDQLAARRRTLGHTQESLAEILGVAVSTVARWEQGVGSPLPALRRPLAEALSVSLEALDRLLGGESASDVEGTTASDSKPSTRVVMPRDDEAWMLEPRTEIGSDEPADNAACALEGGYGDDVDRDDIAAVISWTSELRQVDNNLGGGHALPKASEALRRGDHLLHAYADAPAIAKRAAYAAVARLCQLVGWMCFDIGDLISGERQFRHALRISQEINDDAFSAELLAGLSHHAAFFLISHAGEFAESARRMASQTGIAPLMSEAAVMEAHALALRGDVRGSVVAMNEAERQLDKSKGRAKPPWLDYYDEPYLAAKIAHCFRDLGLPDEAEPHARACLAMSDGYERGRAFNTALLAGVLATRGEVDEACHVGTKAVRLSAQLRSVRSTAYIADVTKRLINYRDSPVVADFYSVAMELGYPIATWQASWTTEPGA